MNTVGARDERFEQLFWRVTGYTVQDMTFRWKNFLGNIEVRGKRVLDVGCGTGKHSLYLASLGGAREVVGVDPSEGAGSPAEAYEIFQRGAIRLGLQNVRLIRDDFRAVHFSEKFDIVLSIAALHHIYVSDTDACLDAYARQEYRRLIEKFYDVVDKGGWLIIVEASRHNITQITKKIGIPAPGFLKSMSWDTKQVPEMWISLCREVNFSNISMDYYVPYRLRWLGLMLRNRFFNYLTSSVYIVRGQRTA